MGPDARSVRALAESMAAKFDVRRTGAGDASRRVRACLRTLAVVGAIGALLFGTLTGAEADTPDGPAAEPAAVDGWTWTLSPLIGERSDLAGCVPGGPPCCALGAMNPFLDDNLVVWTEGKLDCNFEALYMGIEVRLKKDGRTIRTESNEAWGVRSISWPVAELCSSGSWQGVVTAVVTTYGDDTTQVWTSKSRIRSLTCSTSSTTTTTTRPTTTTTRPTTTTTRPTTTTTHRCPNPPHCHEN
jgi:hypothetical protein